MSEILPPDQDNYLLQQLGDAQQKGENLDGAGAEVMEHFGWTLHQYGSAVNRLVTRGWIEAILQRSGDGDYLVVSPDEVTAFGWDKVDELQVKRPLLFPEPQPHTLSEMASVTEKSHEVLDTPDTPLWKEGWFWAAASVLVAILFGILQLI